MKPTCTTEIVSFEAKNPDSQETASNKITKLVEEGYGTFHTASVGDTLVFIFING